MKHFYFVKILVLILVLQATMFASLKSKSAIVYYGDNISYPMVGVHDYIIVDPDYTKVHTTGFKTYADNIYAYVSINEYHKSRSYAKDIDKSWIIGNNSSWGSNVLNITNKDYQNFLLNDVISKLYKKGFKNFFFDTMDSYQLAKVSDKEKIYLKNGVINFIKKFKKKFPNAKLVVNRGFEMIDHIYPYIDAMLFESYYYGIDASTMKYKKVTQSDRDWLDGKLEKVKKHNIPIIALDYIDLNNKIEIKTDIKALEDRGFIPYISTIELNKYGYSSKTAFKREVMIIYNGKGLENDYIGLSSAHMFASLPIEYMGYVPRLFDVNDELPKGNLSSHYAGAIIWLDKTISDTSKVLKWIRNATEQGLKVLILGNSSVDLKNPILKNMGITLEENQAKRFDKREIVKKNSMIGYEIAPSLGYENNMFHIDKGEELLSYKNTKNQQSCVAAIMPWGGYVLDSALMTSYGPDSIWIIDPFKLFKKSLRLKTIPAPDPTTENGKRLAFLHLDGDASMNRVESEPKELSIERFLKHFIKKYDFPQSISLVEAETAIYGKYPKLSKRLESAASKIYSYPYIETATHTYSHPYFWKDIEKDPTNEKYRTHLPKEYKFTLKREMIDSMSYINDKIATKNKHKNKLLFWTGDCTPSVKELAFTYENNIININGGDTYITNNEPWLCQVQPYGIQLGEYYQVYTGQQNENVYTSDWLKAFWSYRKVIQTFDLTNKPKRLKPIDIYFHFYSVSKTASEKALKDVYDWVLKQDVMHIFTSEYPGKVTDFYDVSISNDGNYWLLNGFNDLRTVRINDNTKIPGIDKSIGVAGHNSFNNSLYIHLDDKKSKILKLTNKIKPQNILVSANARLISHNGSDMHFKGYLPIELQFKVKTGCKIITKPKSLIKNNSGLFTIKFKKAKDVHVTQKCN